MLRSVVGRFFINTNEMKEEKSFDWLKNRHEVAGGPRFRQIIPKIQGGDPLTGHCVAAGGATECLKIRFGSGAGLCLQGPRSWQRWSFLAPRVGDGFVFCFVGCFRMAMFLLFQEYGLGVSDGQGRWYSWKTRVRPQILYQTPRIIGMVRSFRSRAGDDPNPECSQAEMKYHQTTRQSLEIWNKHNHNGVISASRSNTSPMSTILSYRTARSPTRYASIRSNTPPSIPHLPSPPLPSLPPLPFPTLSHMDYWTPPPSRPSPDFPPSSTPATRPRSLTPVPFFPGINPPLHPTSPNPTPKSSGPNQTMPPPRGFPGLPLAPP